MEKILIVIGQKYRKLFDEMFSYVILYNSACMLVARPVVIHSILMSILLKHYRQLKELEKESLVNEQELRVSFFLKEKIARAT
jgi:hypothetical protein